MQVFPAVDILGGKCVQLVQGRRETATLYGSPIDCAKRWIEKGAEALHVVNLDGAFGQAKENAALIRQILEETGISIQLGGGIRSRSDAEAWLSTGIDRVILGTLAVRDPEVIRSLSREYGSGRIMAGVDAKAGQIAIEGWQVVAGDYISWAKEFEALGAGSLLYTNVDVEGLQGGIRLGPVKSLIQETGLPVTVAGGISTRADVAGLRSAGAAGIVLGSALYSGRLNLHEAMEEAGAQG